MLRAKSQSLTSSIRAFVRDHYIRPALRAGKREVKVRVGDVHRDMKLHNRVPVVCQALSSKKFLEENALSILQKTGPSSGQSTSVTLTYEIHRQRLPTPGWASLDDLYGSLREVYAAYGGGEKYLELLRSEVPAFPPGNAK